MIHVQQSSTKDEVSEYWLLFNAKWTICQLFHDDEMITKEYKLDLCYFSNSLHSIKE
jgi:hypothetical protein